MITPPRADHAPLGHHLPSGAELDRAAGALLGLATGDALGAPYEFSVPGPGAAIELHAGGPWELGEWTDDTAQAIGIAEVAADGRLDPASDLDRVGQRFLDWYADGPKDVGISTAAVLRAADGDPARLRQAAAAYFDRHPRGAAGNGSLMRTSPVALAHLGDDAGLAAAATAVSGLTHGDPLAAEACVLWCVAVDRAVRYRRLDGVHDGLGLLPSDRAAWWADRLAEAEARDPHAFGEGNGFVVTALQAAHAVITRTPVPADRPALHLQHALEEAVRIGHDTDTVAAIAGQVLGARWGASAIPWAWRRHLHGWPGLATDDLVRLGVMVARGGAPDAIGWPTVDSLVEWARDREPVPVCVPLEASGPDADGGVLVGNLLGIDEAVSQRVDAIVSLCRVGRGDVPTDVQHATFWLVDQVAEEANPNLRFVVEDAAGAVADLRHEGSRVFLHCVAGRSRTPTVAATYLADRDGTSRADALHRVRATLLDVHPNPRFRALLA